jgi:branched-subunit amino acid ABC-type transport system permease component
MAAVIAGFSEMAFWTSPLVRLPGAGTEFERLLNNRLVLSLVAWVLLLGIWLLLERTRKGAAEAASELET